MVGRQTSRPDPQTPAAAVYGDAAEQGWVTDITYIRTWQGWLYLAVVMDLFSRKVVGWSAGPTIHRELVLDAVLMAVRRRRPRGTLIHSDQGTQYGSDAWRRFCRSNHLEPSMSRKGTCWDNAVAESFFSSLKKERIKKQIYRNRELGLNDVADYIDHFYNRTGRHSHLNGVSPEELRQNSAFELPTFIWETDSILDVALDETAATREQRGFGGALGVSHDRCRQHHHPGS